MPPCQRALLFPSVLLSPPASPTPPPQQVDFWAPQSHAAAIAGPSAFLGGGASSILLLGDGDLALAEALAAEAPPGVRVVASVLPSRQEWLAAYPGAAPRLARLEAAPVSVRFKVDATQLHLRYHQGDRLPVCDRLVFTMPHTGDDEDDEAHKQLMRDFFSSAGAMLLRRAVTATPRGGGSGPPPSGEILLTLCNDQLSRWSVEAAARDAFWFMTGAGWGRGAEMLGRIAHSSWGA